MNRKLSPVLNAKVHRQLCGLIAIVDADGTVLTDKYPNIVEYNVITKIAKLQKFDNIGTAMKPVIDKDGDEVFELMTFPNSHLEFLS